MAFPFWFCHPQGYQDSLLNLHNFRYTTQIDVSNAQVTNVLSVLLEGDKAYLIDDVPPPPKQAFVNIINSLMNQGWSIKEDQLLALQHRMKKLLEMDL